MKKILVIDDNELITYSLAKTADHYPAEVSIASSGSDALEKVSSQYYDLCFLELELPDISGVDVMRKIREVSPSTRIALMTSAQSGEGSRRLAEGEADHLITKPFDLVEIRTLLSNLI